MKKEFDILIPYRIYKNLRAVYHRERELNELEAIILSFIYSSKDSHELFYDSFFKTFNLDREKWFKFFEEIINKMVNNEIKEPKVIDNYTMCRDIELKSSIDVNIGNRKFVGLDTKDIKKNLEINFPVFNDLAQVIKNTKLETFNDETLKNSINKLGEISKERFNDDEDIINEFAQENESSYETYMKYESYQMENIEIVFKKEKLELILNENNENIEIKSDIKHIADILDKYNENDLNDLIFFSISQELKIFNLNEYDEIQSKHYLLIDINDYDNEIKNIKNFKNDHLTANDNRKIIIDNDLLFEVSRKSFELTYKENQLGKIYMLVKTNLDLSLVNFIKEELRSENVKVFSLINQLSNVNDLENLNSFIISAMSELIKYSQIKEYVKEKLINKLSEKDLIDFINNDLIDPKNDWKTILRKDENEIIKKIILKNENKNLIIEDNKKSLEKILDSIEYHNLEIEGHNYFNLKTFEDINKLINEYNNIEKITDLYEALKKNDYVKEEIDKLLKNYKNLQNKLFEKYDSKIKIHINSLKEQNLDKLREIKDEFVKLMDKIKDFDKSDPHINLKTVISKIETKKLKNKLDELRKRRNDFSHDGKEKHFPKKEELEKIKKLFTEFKENIKFLESNMKEIEKEIKKANENKGEE